MLSMCRSRNGSKVLKGTIPFTATRYDLVAAAIYATQEGKCVSNRKIVVAILKQLVAKYGLEGLIGVHQKSTEVERKTAEETTTSLFPNIS